MATFDISNCNYITTDYTAKNPAQYYLDSIKKYCRIVVGEDEDVADIAHSTYKQHEDMLIKKLKGEPLNSPNALHKVCYYAFTVMWKAACLDNPRYEGKPFALEYIGIDSDGEIYARPSGFYQTVLHTVKSIIYDPAVKILLSKPDSFGKYPVIDLDKLSISIHKAIREYYDSAEKIDEKLLKSRIPTKTLHNKVYSVIAEFRDEISKVIFNYNPNTTYNF